MKKLILAVLLVSIFVPPAFGGSPKWSVAITVDDMPVVTQARGAQGTADAVAINQRLLAAFAKHHVKAIGFVNQQRVEEDGQMEARAAVLESWLTAGQTLGNHTYSHPKFSDLTLESFEKNTLDGERTIAPLLAKYHQPLRFFRFPFNDTGGTAEKKSAFDKFLAEHHYEVATCTMENMDWLYASLYQDALRRSDSVHAAEIRRVYLDHTRKALDRYEQMSLEMFGHPFPQVMLMHANRLNADSIEEILAMFEARGYKFVSLETAQKDAAYRTPDTFTGAWGIMWQQRWDLVLHKAKPDGPTKRGGLDPPKWVMDEYKNLPKIGY